MINSCKDPGLFRCPVSKNGSDKNIRHCIDDMLIWADSLEMSLKQVHYILQFCASKGIIFNAKKMKLGERSLNIFGYHLDQNGLKPTDDFMDALLKYPTPKNIKEMRGFFGIMAQCSWAIKDKAQCELGDLRTKLQTKGARKWDFTQDDSKKFERVKVIVCDSIKDGIHRVTLGRPLVLMSDWSKLGTGFCLYQISCNCGENDKGIRPAYEPGCCETGWELIMARGRFNTSCEEWYSPVEGELLGIACALHKTHYLTHGSSRLIILTDHKLLVGFLDHLDIKEIENR
jgi:hypothetical protein